MLVLLTNTMIVRVENQDEAGKIAAEMTNKIDAELKAGFEARGLSIEEASQHAAHLGVLVQVVPPDVAD